MGNWIFSSEELIENKIEDIVWSQKFQEYQEKFEELKKPRYLYIEGRDVVIETEDSINSYIFPWHQEDVETMLYVYLNNEYNMRQEQERNII